MNTRFGSTLLDYQNCEPDHYFLDDDPYDPVREMEEENTRKEAIAKFHGITVKDLEEIEKYGGEMK